MLLERNKLLGHIIFEAIATVNSNQHTSRERKGMSGWWVLKNKARNEC